MSKTKRGKQVTCDCGVYPFPHRLNGGKCYGETWAEFYYYYICTECDGCPLNDNWCEVVQGLEPVSNCEAYKIMKRDNDMTIMPFKLEEYEEVR